MTAQILARAAYASPAAPTRTARSIEYDAFARVTHRLKTAIATEQGREATAEVLVAINTAIMRGLRQEEERG